MCACTPIYRNHGYVPRDEDLAAVKVGESTQEDVAFAVGRPAAIGVLIVRVITLLPSGGRYDNRHG